MFFIILAGENISIFHPKKPEFFTFVSDLILKYEQVLVLHHQVLGGNQNFFWLYLPYNYLKILALKHEKEIP